MRTRPTSSFTLVELLGGMLDDIRIYNRALTEAEIQIIYNASK